METKLSWGVQWMGWTFLMPCLPAETLLEISAEYAHNWKLCVQGNRVRAGMVLMQPDGKGRIMREVNEMRALHEDLQVRVAGLRGYL
ncbi:MAG: hypothetical protein ACYDDD_02660 [Acidithiobacillus ferrivorans]